MSGTKIIFEINGKQKERLMFLFDTFYPKWESNDANYKEAMDKLMNEGLHDLYKKTINQINQGNEHDGLPLIKEIYD
jgi:hypothetical protein